MEDKDLQDAIDVVRDVFLVDIPGIFVGIINIISLPIRVVLALFQANDA